MDDVPVFSFNKTKLKNLSFAHSVSSLLFQNFSKEPSTASFQFGQPEPFQTSHHNTELNDEPVKASGSKRAREEVSEASPANKKTKIIEIPEPKYKKKVYNNDNYRRLNMKSFKFKGKGGGQFNLTGAKYKRFKWKKNKQSTQYGPDKNYDDDDDANLNLISSKSAVKKHKNNDDREIDDPTSNEALFAKTNNFEQTNTIATENREQTQQAHKETILKVNKKKSPKKAKESKKKPILKEKNSNENEKKNNEESDTVKSKKQTRTKRASKKADDIEPEIEVTQLPESQADEIEENVKPVKSNKKLKKPSKTDASDDELENETIVSDSQIINPVFDLDAEGNPLPSLPDYVYKVLDKDFAHKSFKPHQADAVLRVCSGLSTLVVLSTGYGKSLIYQMAARLYAKKYPGAVVLVISPLISLMQDQLHNLSKCLKAAVCDSTMNEKEYQLMLQDLSNGKINILYMSPEAIMSKKIKHIPRLAFVCIDEVHCLSEWSHNFRPSYLLISQILSDHYNVKTILGLTATATKSTINEIGTFFSIHQQSILIDCDLPSNLSISVSKDQNKERALVELFRSKQFQPYFNHVIIYCSRREQTEKIAQLLRLSFQSSKKLYTDLSEIEKRPKGITSKSKSAKITDNEEKSVAEAYHAGLTNQQRKRIQNDFIKGKLRVICATMAFGMGINMSNIRSVIHYNMPKSIENYVQEIGRAGRDGQLSRCHLFLETQQEDINEIKKYIHMNGYDQKTIKKIILKIFDCCTEENCKHFKNHDTENIQFYHQVALPIDELVDLLDIKEETILTLLCYLQSAKKVKLMQNCYKYCTIKSYKGQGYLNDLAKKNQMVAKLLEQKPTGCGDDFNIDVIQLCEQLNADYDSIRQSLKRLEWQIDEYGTFKAKSGISIEFQTKSFYLKRKCIIDESELDDVNDHLWSRVSSQMNFSHYNFKAIYKILSENSFNSVGAYIDSFPVEGQSESDLIEKKSNSLKQHFNKYFSNQLDLEEFTKNTKLDYETSYSEEKEKHVAGNIKKFIYTYEKDAKLTGVVIARIMHGISTPRYPAEVWGRNRNFWRAHLDVEFERLRDLCTKQLLNC